MGLVERVAELVQSGGFVMPWLILGNVVLWGAIGDRALALREQVVREARRRVAGQNSELGRRVVVQPLLDGLDRHSALIRSLTGLAPLVGLLGTVTGMIETFDSLTSMSLFRSSGGIAGGISAALISTQMGLAVAIPGLVVGRLLDRRASRISTQLEGMVTS